MFSLGSRVPRTEASWVDSQSRTSKRMNEQLRWVICGGILLMIFQNVATYSYICTYVLNAQMLFHNRPRADIKPVIVVRKIRGKVVKFGSSGIKLVPLEAVDLSNSRIFGLIKLDFPFLSGSDYITSCCIGLLLFG